MRVNDHGWITIPELTTPPGAGQCYLSQFNVVVDVPLTDLVQGNNTFTGTNGGQSCHSFDWGQHGWNGIIFRIYYGPGKAHPAGSITSPSVGATFGELPTITATANSGSGIQRVDFLAYYDGLDTDGDGIYKDWHYYYHCAKSETNVNISGHVGTAYSSPYNVTWNTDLVPDRSRLDQNYPNPFNPSTVIRYGLTHRTAVKLVVFNTLGQLVATLFDGEQGPGYHEARFDAAGLPGGVYFYRMTADDFTQTRKLTLLR